MLSKNRNLVFAIVLIIALAILAIIKFSGNTTANFRGSLDNFDAEQLNYLEIKSPYFENPLKLKKEKQDWFFNIDGKNYAANNQKIKSIVSELNGSRIKRVVSTKKSDWEKYNTDDSLGTKINFYHNKNLLSSIILGRFDYIQDKDNAEATYGGRTQGETVTYISLPGENEVYSINSMLPIQMGKTIDDYRDKTLLKLDKNKIQKVDIKTKDYSYSLEKSNNSWLLDGTKTDSLKVRSFLNKFANLRGNTFSGFVPQSEASMSEMKVLLSDGNGIKINSYYPDTDSTIIVSSQFPENSFLDKNNSIYKKLFVEKSEFKKDE